MKRKIYIDVLGNREIHIKATEVGNVKDVHGDAPPGFASLLAVSRQIYVEANPVFWSNNTFVFPYPLAFALWFKKRNKTEKQALRSLSFVMDLTNLRYRWDKYISERIIKQLPRMFDLRLEIHLFKFRSDYTGLENDPSYLDTRYITDPDFHVIRKLARLPLTTIEVSVIRNFPRDDLSSDMWCTENNQWTEFERQCYEDLTKRILLDPDPAGIEAQLEAEGAAIDEALWRIQVEAWRQS